MNVLNTINPYVWLRCGLLFAIVLPTFAANPDPVSSTKAPQFSIENISASTSPGNLLVIKVSMNQPLTNPPPPPPPPRRYFLK